MFQINYEKNLNREQLRVVEDSDGSCLVLAGAGTGKTRTIVYKVAYLLEKGVPPEKILLLTFTNKAAHQMLKRVEGLLESKPAGLLGGTFHHIGNLVLRRYGNKLGLSRDFTIMDEDDSRRLLAQVIAELGFAGSQNKIDFPKAKPLSDIISFSVNSCRDLSEIIEERLPIFFNRAEDIQNVALSYERKKRQKNLVDFDDLLDLWLKLFLRFPELKHKLERQFQYVLVDEYQDTNRLQGKIIEQLAGRHQNILVVGDDAQSIYGFRAAAIENILNFPKIFPDTRIFYLNQNYRSTVYILNFANAILKNNFRQFEKELTSMRGSGEKPELYALEDDESEACFIVDKIMDFCEEGELLLDSAVLFRAAYQAMRLELELQKRGIPYIIRGGMRFFEQAHIKDLVAYLRVLQNNSDELAWMRILQLEDGIGEKTAVFLTSTLTNLKPHELFAVDFNSKFQIPKSKFEGLGRIIKRQNSLERINKERIDLMIMYLMEDFYQSYMESAYEDAKERCEDLRQLAEFSKHYASLEQFLSDATLSEGFRGERAAPGKTDENKEYLVLSTIHQAKGLEWKNVFVIGLVEGQFPHYRAWNNLNEIEEERRLFYVAATRAKERLCLTYPISSASAFYHPSIFVRELDPALLKMDIEEEKVIDIED